MKKKIYINAYNNYYVTSLPVCYYGEFDNINEATKFYKKQLKKANTSVNIILTEIKDLNYG